MHLLERVADTIGRHRMFRGGERVAVAVSGGPDSVCLLDALLRLAPRWDLRLSLAHVEHGLRGAESRADAAFVAAIAREHGLEFRMREIDAAAAGGNLEQAARDARRAWFRELLDAGAADCVALGHTLSDQAETVLFRFLRGAGTAGLAAIRPAADGLVRPLLGVTRAEVEGYLREHGIAWREDSSNASPDFARNRLRHSLLPQLAREWNPAIVETLARTADWALAEEAYWAPEIARLGAAHLVEDEGALLVSRAAIRGLPVAAARRLVRRTLERVKGDLRGIGFEHVEAVLEMAATGEGSGRVQVPGVDVMRSFDWLRFGRPGEIHLETRGYRLAAPVPGRVAVPGSRLLISLELIDKSKHLPNSDCVYNESMAGIDWRRVSGPLECRSWQPGDRYQPKGSASEEKLKTLFQQARIPLWERRYWPVLTDGPSIVWARRFGPDERFAADSGSPVVLEVREEAL